MSDSALQEQSAGSTDKSIPISADICQVANDLCERAPADAKSQLRPLLRNLELAQLEKRTVFLQAFKSALEQRTARTAADWQSSVQAICQFDETRLAGVESWDGSIDLLAKVSCFSNAIETLGRKLDRAIIGYLKQPGWQCFGEHGAFGTTTGHIERDSSCHWLWGHVLYSLHDTRPALARRETGEIVSSARVNSPSVFGLQSIR